MRAQNETYQTNSNKKYFCESVVIWHSCTIAFAQGKNIPSAKMPKIGPPVIPNRAIAAYNLKNHDRDLME